MFKKINVKKIIVPIMLVMIGTFFISGTAFAENENNLKSKPAPSIDPPPSPRTPEPRIPNGLKKHSVGIGIGQTFLVGEFEDLGENKISWELLYSYSASHSFDLLMTFHHEKYSFKEQWIQASGLAIGIKGKAYQFDAFSPYAVFGFGFYGPKAKRTITVNNAPLLAESASKLIFGWHAGAGADLRLNQKFSIGILFQYHNPFDIKQEIGPKVTGSYAKMLITGMYSF